MFDQVQSAVDELCGHAIESVVDLAEFFCPCLSDYLSWDHVEPTVSLAIEEEFLPANIATVFSVLPETVHDWLAASKQLVLDQAARAA